MSTPNALDTQGFDNFDEAVNGQDPKIVSSNSISEDDSPLLSLANGEHVMKSTTEEFQFNGKSIDSTRVSRRRQARESVSIDKERPEPRKIKRLKRTK